jgi:hypothetical protein
MNDTIDLLCGNDTSTTTASNSTDSGIHSVFAYFLIPILLLEFFLSAFANVIMLVLIGRSYQSMTTLNVFLMSLSILNLIVTVNQPIFMGLISNESIPTKMCFLTFTIQNLGTYGVIFLHLSMSYNRYHTTINPIHWESNIRKAWKSVARVSIVAVLLAVLPFSLHIKGIEGDTHSCFWPSLEDDIGYKITLRMLFYIAVWGSIVVTAYYYYKTIKLHNDTRAAMEREMEMTADIQQHVQEQNSPEKTTKSLVMVFVIQTTALMIPLTYDIIRTFVTAVNSSDPSPTVLLLFLTTLGLFATTGLFFLILVNPRYRKNVAGIFKCKCNTNKIYLQSQNVCRADRTVEKCSEQLPGPNLSSFQGDSLEEKYLIPT